ALALDGVEVSCQRGHESLALAGAHFGDLAPVEHDAADHLHVEMSHPEDTLRSLAHGGESLRQDVIERLPASELVTELRGLRLQFRVRKALELWFDRVDG